jgi:hypothetical protein
MINQDDDEEQSSQIGQMGLIYAAAQRVLGWLDQDPGAVNLAIDHLQKFNRLPDMYTH